MGQHADDCINAMIDAGYYGTITIRPKISGPGECPQCGATTTIKNGKHGKFYGCAKYPACKGSRYYDATTEAR